MSDDRHRPIWPCIVALLIGLPVIYVLSSDPMQSVAFHRRVVVSTSHMHVERERFLIVGEWWPRVFLGNITDGKGE
jgi:hypothetical protein